MYRSPYSHVRPSSRGPVQTPPIPDISPSFRVAVAYATRPTHEKGFDLVTAICQSKGHFSRHLKSDPPRFLLVPVLALATFGSQSVSPWLTLQSNQLPHRRFHAGPCGGLCFLETPAHICAAQERGMTSSAMRSSVPGSFLHVSLPVRYMGSSAGVPVSPFLAPVIGDRDGLGIISWISCSHLSHLLRSSLMSANDNQVSTWSILIRLAPWCLQRSDICIRDLLATDYI